MVLVFLGQPFVIVVVYGAFFMPFLALTLVWLLNSSRTPGQWRNGWLSDVLLVAAAALSVVLCVDQLLGLVGCPREGSSRLAARHARHARNGLATKRHIRHHLKLQRIEMGAGLSTTFERDAEPTRTTSGRPARTARSAGAVTGLLLVLMAAALATASPAAAVDDPTRPDAEVTRGPSCRPGGIVVEISAGSAPYTVRLSTTRQPAGEDEVTLAAGAQATLQTGDVAPGERIDPRLEFASLDGSGVSFVDELEDYTLTRPTTEDCQAALSPAPAPAEPSATVEATSPAPSQTPGPTTDGRTPSSTPSTSPRSTSGPTSGAPSRTSGEVLPPVERPAPGAPQQVEAGGAVTLRGTGFLPGETVDILLHGAGTVLASATAGADGQLRVDVRIPGGVTAGPATLDLVGADSAVVTGVELEVAANRTPSDASGSVLSLVPLVAAAAALVGTTGGLVSVAGRQQALRRRRVPLRPA